MVKFRYEWFLFDYKDGAPDVRSKHSKRKQQPKKRQHHLII